MKRSFALLLTGGLLSALTACDYNNTPGRDPQTSQDFTQGKPANATDTNRDSISGGDEAYTPIGTGSPVDQKKSVDAAMEGAPKDANSPATAAPSNNSEANASTREQ
ncbi:hypothetical protein GCM10027346_27120 [Hymenobacter seoulensis]